VAPAIWSPLKVNVADCEPPARHATEPPSASPPLPSGYPTCAGALEAPPYAPPPWNWFWLAKNLAFVESEAPNIKLPPRASPPEYPAPPLTALYLNMLFDTFTCIAVVEATSTMTAPPSASPPWVLAAWLPPPRAVLNSNVLPATRTKNLWPNAAPPTGFQAIAPPPASKPES
jgi:hypothetical protein